MTTLLSFKVDPDKKGSWLGPTALVFGGSICTPLLMLGAMFSGGMGVGSVALSVFTGFGIIGVYAAFIAMQGAKMGLPTSSMAADSLGVIGAQFFVALPLAVAGIGWFGVQSTASGGAFSALCAQLLGINIPVWLSTIIWGGVVLVIVSLGRKAIFAFAGCSLLFTVPFLVYAVAAVLPEGAAAQIASYRPAEAMPFSAVVTTAVGIYAMGGIVIADHCRYVRKHKNAALVGIIGMTVMGTVMILLGASFFVTTGQWDIIALVAQKGHPLPALVATVLFTCVVNLTNGYCGGIAVSNLFGVPGKNRWITTAIACAIGIALGMAGILNMITGVISFVGTVSPAIAGTLIASFWIKHKGKAEDCPLLQEGTELPEFRLPGIASLITGILVIYITGNALPFFIPAINGLFAAFISFLLFDKFIPENRLSLTTVAETKIAMGFVLGGLAIFAVGALGVSSVMSLTESTEKIDAVAEGMQRLQESVGMEPLRGAVSENIVRGRQSVTLIIFVSLTGMAVVAGIFISLFNHVRRQRKELVELRKIAESASEAKSAFLANTSHEIRTPMNAVIGMAELALRKGVSPDVREDILSIRQAGQNLLSIINDILDFSKIESGKMEIVPVEYALSSLINDCLSIIKMRLYEKELLFTADIDSALPNKLLGDETRIRQVTLNLLSNAVKYTKKGSITLGIHGENTGKDNITLRIEVRDTGIGIKPEDMGKLFGEFNQFDSHKNRGVEGTGLGLAISRQLCRLMGGDITVESSYGEGSVFTAVIPQQVIDPAPFKLAEDTVSLEEKWSVQFTAPDAKILIVDDVETNLKIVSGLLALYQTDITTTTSGEAAIELVKKSSNGGQFDFILMDHMMPGMDGIEATAAIRALDGKYFKTVPIIALTANAVSGMREMYLAKGFNDYLSKPIEIDKLDKLMEKWVPGEKQKKGTGEWGLGNVENAGESSEFSKAAISTPLSLSGVDTAKGIAMTGGTEAGYKKVLSMFCKDVEERLAFLRKVPEEKDLPLFTTQVHALKSASGSIGAAELSAQAAELEAAGNAGDTAVITEKLPCFAEKLAALAEAIKKATTDREEKIVDQKSAPSVSSVRSVVNPLLGELATALEAQKADAVDRLLAEIEKLPLDAAIKEKLEQISDDVLMAEFDKALETAHTLLGENNE